MEGGPLVYAGIFAGSLLLALVLTPLALRVAVRGGALDHPGGHKAHEAAVPYLGGVAIVVAFSSAVLAAALVEPPVGGVGQLVAVLGIGVALALLGLVDDLRGLPAWLRLGAEVLAGLGLWAFGEGVALFSSDPANAALTVLWVVGIANAFNLLDNMDGLSAGVAAVAAAWLFALAAANGQFLVAALAIALAGCALGFLRSNFHPARIYMGDAGSLFLGFVLAALGVKLRFTGPLEATFFVPVLVLGVAIFDTTLVTVTRLLHRRSPFQGGRDHVSHRLVKVGLPVRAAVSLIHAAAVALGWLAVVMARVDRATGFILMGLVVAVSAFLGALLGAVPVYDTSRRRHLALTEVAPPAAVVDLRVGEPVAASKGRR